MIPKEVISQIVTQHIEGTPLSLVKVTNNKENNIKIFITRTDRGVSIDDCVELSRFIETKLDRDVEDYSLMVSSAGIQPDKNDSEEYDD